MRILEAKKDPNFIVFPEDDVPNPKENQHCWMWKVQKGKEGSNFADHRRGIQSYYADTKTRGGGTFPLTWRSQMYFYELPEGIEFPLDDGDKNRIVNCINEEEYQGQGAEPQALSSHELEYTKNRNGLDSFQNKYPEFARISKFEIKYR